jgi:predicted ATPase
VTRLLQRVTRDRPLVVVLDDAQWADAGSLLLLRQVGLTNREIAGRIYLSERTAQNHVQR